MAPSSFASLMGFESIHHIFSGAGGFLTRGEGSCSSSSSEQGGRRLVRGEPKAIRPVV